MEDKETRAGYVSLEKIVYGFLDSSDRGEESYRKAFQLGIKAYREMMLDVVGPVSFAIINVLANKTGKLPLDYSRYIRVGIPNSNNGKLATFTEDDDLSFLNEMEDDRLSNDGLQTYDGNGFLNPQSIARDTYFPYFNYSSLGIGSINQIGAFKIDKPNGWIVFDPDFAYSKVVMEYKADINCQLEDYMVDSAASQAIEDYIIWKWNWQRKDVSAIDKRMFRAEYYNQKRIARNRMNPVREQDINDSARKSVMGGIKS